MTRRPSSATGRVAGLVAAVFVASSCTTSRAPAPPPVSQSRSASGSAAASQTPSADGSPSASALTQPPSPQELRPIDPATLANFYSQRVAWSACGSGLECGSLKVPLDYTNPSGAVLSLALIRHVSTAPDRIGSVVLNPGGPGGSGVQFAKTAWQAISKELQDRFDVVSFDPRGVGASEPIRCVSSKVEDDFVSYDADPHDASEVAALGRLDAEFANGCAQKSGALLPHVGTVDTARDLDVLRAALGDAKLTYIGESYGTLLGAIYAQLFPTHVRAMVLDGAVDPSLDDVAQGNGQARGFETALKSFITWCVGRSDCALGRSASGAEARLDAWLDKLLTAPQVDRGRELTRSLATTAVATGLYSPASWSALNAALRSAFDGNPSAMFALADALNGRQRDGSYSNLLEANVAINCADRPAASGSINEAAQSAAAGAANGPTFGAQLGWGNSTCIGWPVPAELRPGPVRAAGAPPIVVIGNLRDPATPLVWAQSLAAQLASGVLVTADLDGHTANLRSSCVDGIVSAYVTTLKVPDDGTACPG